MVPIFLLSEVTFQKSSEACTVTSLVLSHLVNGVVDSIEAGSLGVLGDTELVLAGTSLSGSSLLKVCLGVPYALTQQLCETRSVVSLLKGLALESLSDFGIALAVSLTSHSQIHTNLTALTIEVVAQVVNHLL